MQATTQVAVIIFFAFRGICSHIKVHVFLNVLIVFFLKSGKENW